MAPPELIEVMNGTVEDLVVWSVREVGDVRPSVRGS